MPLPWKKTSNKINRVSTFINEIRASKRGESLVLQPGFPTSLIDLIVKNRNRLNNNSSSTPSSKKKNKKNQFSEETESTPRTPIAPFILNSISTLFADSQENSKSDSSNYGKKICVLNYEEQELKCIQTPITSRRFMLCVQLFAILILALGPKKVAIAVTLSACILVFLEILLKRLKVSTDLQKGKSLARVEESTNTVVTNFVGLREEFNSLIKEKLVKKIELDSLNDDCDQKTSKYCEETIECAKLGNPRRTRSAKLKANQFKKFVVKKFGGDSKNRRSSKDEIVDSSNAEFNCSVQEERVEEDREIDEEEKEDDKANGCEPTSVSDLNSDEGIREILGKKTSWSWRTFIPVGIILAGLVRGRIMALALSILGFVLITLHKAIRAPREKYVFDKSCLKKCSSL